MKRFLKDNKFSLLSEVGLLVLVIISRVYSDYMERTGNILEAAKASDNVTFTVTCMLLIACLILVSEQVNKDIEEAFKPLDINIKYFDNEISKIEKITKGDWIDLRAAETIHLEPGDFRLIPLGVGMKLPEGYEANFVPRSSTFKKYGILQTNAYSVIDNSYSGDDDQWLYPVYATKSVTINKNDRICQFRINEIQPAIKFNEVEHLGSVNRSGFGSTGSN